MKEQLLFFIPQFWSAWTLGQKTFTYLGINYTVTNTVAPFTVSVADNSSFVGVADIPTTVRYNNEIYTVTSIGHKAFNRCKNLTSVKIPDSVTSIGDGAFNSCTALTSVAVNWISPIAIDANVFNNVGLAATTLYTPLGTKIICQNVAVWSDFGSIVESATHLNFDAVNDCVSLPPTISNMLSEGNEMTIEYWFKGANVQSSVRFQGVNGYIVAGWGGGNPLFIISTDRGTNGVEYGSATVIKDNTWHHFACVWKKNAAFTTYLDGVLQNSRVAADVNLPNISNVTGCLGSYNGSSEFMNGNLDNVRIWNVARTTKQISTSKNCELQGKEAGLLAYYKYNQGFNSQNNSTVTTLADAS